MPLFLHNGDDPQAVTFSSLPRLGWRVLASLGAREAGDLVALAIRVLDRGVILFNEVVLC